MIRRAAGPARGRRHGARSVLGRAPSLGLPALFLAAGCAAAPGAAGSPAAPPVDSGAAPTALPSAGELQTSCADALDDGVGADLAGVWLVRQGDTLVAEFTFVAPPVSGAAFLTVELRTAGGAVARQLGVELDGTRPVAAYVATSPTDPVQRLDGAVHVQGADVHAAFPADVLDDLAPGWGWVASVSSETALQDTCPGAATGPITPVAAS